MFVQRSIWTLFATVALALVVAVPARAQTGQNLPAGFTAKDIGDPGAVGSTVVDANGVWTIKGAGADLWGPDNDDFQFAYTPVTGDGVIIARYLSAEGGHETWIKNGVMIRANDSKGSPHVITEMRSVGSGCSFHWRDQQDMDSGDNGAVPGFEAGKFPIWMMTQRVGNDFSGFLSYDGKFWTQIGSRTVQMPATALFGICVMSHIDGELMTAKFDNVRALPGVGVVTGGRGAATDKQALFVWNPVKNAVGYLVYRGADVATAQPVNATPQTDTSFYESADGGLNKLIYGVTPVFMGADGKLIEGPGARLW
jgi:hypothetical protein